MFRVFIFSVSWVNVLSFFLSFIFDYLYINFYEIASFATLFLKPPYPPHSSKDFDTSCRVLQSMEDKALEGEDRDTCSLRPYQTFYSYFRLIFQPMIHPSSSVHLAFLYTFNLIFRK